MAIDSTWKPSILIITMQVEVVLGIYGVLYCVHWIHVRYGTLRLHTECPKFGLLQSTYTVQYSIGI